jgi:hypothetical protein
VANAALTGQVILWLLVTVLTGILDCVSAIVTAITRSAAVGTHQLQWMVGQPNISKARCLMAILARGAVVRPGRGLVAFSALGGYLISKAGILVTIEALCLCMLAFQLHRVCRHSDDLPRICGMVTTVTAQTGQRLMR